MSSFSESNLQKRLSELNQSQQSIQSLSLWLIHHRKHSKIIVNMWMKELKKSRPNKKLTFLYLANDVIQNSKKKGPEFHRDFRIALPVAFKYAAREADGKVRNAMDRVLTIWKERGVFDPEFVESCKKAMTAKVRPSRKEEKQEKSEEKKEKPAKQKSVKKKKVELSLREEIEQELAKGPPRDPPEPEELITGLQELDNAASADAAVREQIAALPPEVSDVSLVDKLTDQEEAEKLSQKVSEACEMLDNYNGRLADELVQRREVARMLRAFIVLQKESLSEAEKKLQDHKTKLDNVSGIRKDLKSHIQSLPDLTLLPDVTGGLAPLPSAGDLFAAGE